MSFRSLAPESLAPPFARYAHGVEIEPGKRMVRTAGQLAMAKDGTIPEGSREQADLVFANIEAVLAEGGMTKHDVCHLFAFVTGREHMAGYMAARDVWLADVTRLPASTLIIVGGFTREEFVVEIEATAVA
jgi:enamine deaminase RidA (YjgF/YER057c/UK114 family)